jgi:hypothetical protein
MGVWVDFIGFVGVLVLWSYGCFVELIVLLINYFDDIFYRL